MYDSSFKYKWDNKNVLDTAVKEAVEEAVKEADLKAREEEKKDIARELKKEGLSFDFIARTTKLSVEEIEKALILTMYDSSLKYKWDNKNVLDTAIKEAREEERLKAFEEKKAIALELKKEGLSFDFIARTTKLSVEEIEKL